MKRVYLSGASAEIDLIESYRDRLHAEGFEVLDGWMLAIRKARAAGLADADLTRIECGRHAENDLYDVAKSDVYWLLVPDNQSKGAWVDLGFALGDAHHARSVVASGAFGSIFTFHPRVLRYDDHEQAFAAIVAESR